MIDVISVSARTIRIDIVTGPYERLPESQLDSRGDTVAALLVSILQCKLSNRLDRVSTPEDTQKTILMWLYIHIL